MIPSLLALKSHIAASSALANNLIDQAMLQLALSGLNFSGAEFEDAGDDGDEPDNRTDEVEEAVALKNNETSGPPVPDAADPSFDVEDDDDSDPGSIFAAFAFVDEEPLFPAKNGTRSADEVEAFARQFAEWGEARFLKENDASETPARSGREDVSSPSTTASMPSGQGSGKQSDPSLSRHGGGGQQTTHPRGPNQPCQGESDKFHGESSASRSAPVPTVQGSATHKDTSLSRSNGGAQQGALPLEPNKPAQGESDTTGGSANGTA